MNEGTWKELQVKATIDIFFPEQFDSKYGNVFEVYINKQIHKAVYFIRQLLKNNISLNRINISDFNSKDSFIEIDVDNRTYCRLAKTDYKLALKSIKTKENKIKYKKRYV